MTFDDWTQYHAQMNINLGSGARPQLGYVNVDKYDRFQPDLLWDLEFTPWPFAAGSVDEIRAHHVLEHLGQDPDVFLAIMLEMHRILKPGGLIDIVVPPGHGEGFACDPTHVRPIYPQTFLLFSKAKCAALRHAANTPLADYLDVDFEIDAIEIDLEDRWRDKEISDFNFVWASYNGVYAEVAIRLRKVDPAAPPRPALGDLTMTIKAR